MQPNMMYPVPLVEVIEKTPPKPWATHREWAFAIPIPKMGDVFPY